MLIYHDLSISHPAFFFQGTGIMNWDELGTLKEYRTRNRQPSCNHMPQVTSAKRSSIAASEYSTPRSPVLAKCKASQMGWRQVETWEQNAETEVANSSLWLFPKMVVPNNHGFSYQKWSFWGVWGYHHLRKHPYNSTNYIFNKYTFTGIPFYVPRLELSY